MLNIFSIFLGGGIGSLLRHWACLKVGNHWAIMLVNVIGALMIGILFQYFASRADLRPEIRTFIITGLLGGFTTFSTYMLDFGNLLSNQKTAEAFVYLLGSLAFGIFGLFIGIRLGKMCF